jgi:hypothetical protein
MGKIAFMGEGQGDDIPSAIYVMEPTAPYNTTGRFDPEAGPDPSDSQQLLWPAIQLFE